jgi:hypothetical protein
VPRHPLLPLLRVGLVLGLGAMLLYRPKRPTVPTPPVDAVWATDVDAVPPGQLRAGEKARPLEGQKRPPCNRHSEVEVAGACWIEAAKRPPCPPGLYEGRGMCLVPVFAAARPPTSLGR